MVGFLLRQVCGLCGCSCRGMDIRRVRVNVRTLRSVGPGLVWTDRDCPECRHPVSVEWSVAGLCPSDVPGVEAARQRLRARRKGAAA